MSLTNEDVQQIHSMFKEGYNKDFIYKAVKDWPNSKATRKEVRLEAKHLESNKEYMKERDKNMKEVKERQKLYKEQYGKKGSYVKDREEGYLYRQTGEERFAEGVIGTP